jgi:hypothetical protein
MAGTEDVADATEHAGIEAFGQTFHSDHRGLFVDIDVARILNGHPADLGALQPRGISGTDPRTILPFQKAVAKYYSQHKMTQRQIVLSRFLDQPPLEEEQKSAMNALMQGLDRDLSRAFAVGTKKGTQTFKSPWSVTITNQRKIIRYWKLWETEIRTSTDMYDQRTELFGQIDWEEDIPLFQNSPTLCQIKGKSRQAIKHHRNLLKDSKREREKFLEDRANYWALNDQPKAEKILKRIKQAEAAKSMFAHLGAIRGKSAVSPVKLVSIPIDPDKPLGPLETFYDHDKVSELILQRNQKHFGQATGTNFTKASVTEHLGRHGEGGLIRDGRNAVFTF